ncbi:uncharacterized protein LOC121391866 isoform X2 [Gigantopelta aegis]|uniref:uncharacterized protein LOC121391866 isoform X2 n=1 Tax=Gigantopelta aegis TaxID=1735272 RepID=UPI001B88DFCA|nr:uncharacterized protein LOC121391866 isoform X2 [Gigantopelta aegis]
MAFVNSDTTLDSAVSSSCGSCTNRSNTSSYRTVFGVESRSRPELNCRPDSVLQHLSQHNDWKSAFIDLMKNCAAVIRAEGTLAAAITEMGLLSFLMTLESSLLGMSSPALTDGILFFSLFQIHGHLYVRYFESGRLSGFFRSKGLNIIRKSVGGSYHTHNIFHLQVFNATDIEQHQKKIKERLEEKRKAQNIVKPQKEFGQRFHSIMVENKTGVLKSHMNLMALVQQQESTMTETNSQLIGTVLHVIRKDSHKCKLPSSGRFMIASGIFDDKVSEWEGSLQLFRNEGTSVKEPTLQSLLDLTSDSLTWDKQCTVLSALPNFHHWIETHVGYSRMLSLGVQKYKPASARNLILYYYREVKSEAMLAVMRKLYFPDTPVEVTSTACQDSGTSDIGHTPAKRRRLNTTNARRSLTADDILRNLSVIDPKYNTTNRISNI